MRLPEVLSKAPDTSNFQVENFLGSRKLGWGQHKKINAGKIIRNYSCRTCGDIRTYFSGDSLSCLVTGDRTVSIDATLRCSACRASTEAWFLVGCEDDLFSPAPVVHLERFTENRRDSAGVVGTEEIDDLFLRARIAFDDHLGAGAMIYLRKSFEMTTLRTAMAIGVATHGAKGKRKNFRDLLQEVDAESQIIPTQFSSNGYRLFSELSGVIHGDSDEAEALSKYKPCRQLVYGIVSNVRNKAEFAQAMDALGWTDPSPLIESEGMES
jgi:hypothetical protein